jgi:hypothetical protein
MMKRAERLSGVQGAEDVQQAVCLGCGAGEARGPECRLGAHGEA